MEPIRIFSALVNVKTSTMSIVGTIIWIIDQFFETVFAVTSVITIKIGTNSTTSTKMSFCFTFVNIFTINSIAKIVW